MNTNTSETVTVFLPTWHEYAVFDTRNITPDRNGRRTVTARGQMTGRAYLIILDDDNHVIRDW